MTQISKFPDDSTRPLIILSVGHPQRERRTIEQIITPLINRDPLSRASLAYWLITVEDEDGNYLCSRSYNNALWECQSPMVIFSTGDSFIPATVFYNAYKVYLETGHPVLTLRMDQCGQESEDFERNDHAIGDFMLMPKEWAIEAGGWDERMLQWGFADYAFSIQLEKIGHPPLILGQDWRDRVIHLWHPQREVEWYKNQNKKNFKIFRNEPPWTKEDFLAGRMHQVEV